MRTFFILLAAVFFTGICTLADPVLKLPAAAHDLPVLTVRRPDALSLQSGMPATAIPGREFTGTGGTTRDLRAWHLEDQGRPIYDNNSFRFQTFMFRHEQENVRATVGDVKIQSSDLIAPSLSRKGALIGVRKDGYTAEAFTVRGGTMQGFRRGIGQPHDGRILLGGRVSRAVLEDRDLRFTFHYLDSRNENPFASTSGSGTSRHEGTAYSSAIEGSVFGSLLRFSGEYCYSRYDENPEAAEETVSDSAWKVKLSGSAGRFTYALGYKLLGEDFHTIASPYALNDREELFVDTEYLLGSSCASFSILQSRSDVEDDLTPVTVSRTGRIGYKIARTGWPVLFASQSLSTRRSAEAPAGYASPVDSTTRTTYFSISFSRGAFDLVPSYSISRFLDSTRPAGENDSLTHTARLACGISPGQWLSVTPVFAYRNYLLKETDVRVRTYQGSLTSTVQVIPGVLTVDTMVSYLEKEASDGSASLVQKKAGYQLSWHIEKYLRKVGARSLAFMGEFMHTDDHTGNIFTRDYTISLVASIGLPADLLDYQCRFSRFPREARELPF